jgi:LmbE family N-acetylglucosaminyl deacetylase
MSSSVSGRRLEDLVLAALALPWDMAFAALGWLAPARAARWSSSGGLRVLVIAPHPDDEVAGCGGTILLHRQRGDVVTVLYVTNGGASRALGLGPEEMARRRRIEADQAAAILDVKAVWLGLPEREWDSAAFSTRLGELLAEEDPDVVYAPSCVDFHPDHRRVAAALGHVLAARETPAVDQDRPLVRAYETQVPLTATLVGRVAPIGGVEGPLRQALDAHATQLGSLRRTLRMKRYSGLRHRSGGRAEVFWEMTPRGYAEVHAGSDRRTSPRDEASVFRGVRPTALIDPLAYLAGGSARRRLARLRLRPASMASGGAAPPR